MSYFIKNKFVLLLWVLLLTISCNTTKTIIIEIPKPAEKELPEHIQSLALVNRTVDNQYSDWNTDSLQKIFYTQNFRVDTFVYDIQAADTLLKALGELLYESGRFDYVIPKNRFIEAEKSSFFSSTMPWAEVKNICETFKTDAVLSVDMYKTRVITNFKKESYFDQEQNGYFIAAFAQMNVIYEVLFRVYDPLKEKIVASEFFKDTLLWEDGARTTLELFHRFTPVKKALAEAGIAVALDFSEKISTNWQEEKRPFYVKGDANLKHAGMLIDNGDWQGAMVLWKETVENTNSKSLKSKAQLNIAIANEILGDIDNAISWALDSYNTMYRQITYYYLELLEERKKEIKKSE